jgi:hypothetical protein
MGGKRVAEQVRRALILAAKAAPIVVAIDQSGCGCAHACAYDDGSGLAPAGGGFTFATGGWASADSGPLIFMAGSGGVGGTMGMSGRDSGSLDARADAPSTDARDAGKDGG